MENHEKKYYEDAAKILTKVFNASRLQTEVLPEMVELLEVERKREEERSLVILERLKVLLANSDYECEREAIVRGTTKKEVIISGRVKTIISAMYNLLATKNGQPQNLNDMLGLMIMCENIEDCYEIRDLLIERLKENGDTIISEKDLIAEPKKNGYQSIHIHISNREGIIYEIQIKTYKMFAFSQTGDCKHDLYKRKLHITNLTEEEEIIFDSLKEEFWF